MEEESLLKGRELIVIRYLDPSMSNQLLGKYPDYSVYGFDYSQSAIWSPLVPRFHSLCSLNTATNSPHFKKKLSFDDDVDVDVDVDAVNDTAVGCNAFGKLHLSGIKRKVCDFGSKLNANLKKKRLLKFGRHKSSKVSDFPPNPKSPPSSKKGWKKALKMTSKQFKKKKEHQIIQQHHPTSRITLADYLQCQNL